MNLFNLKEKTILVTGASSGIGKQAAISISEVGGEVIIIGRNEERLRNTFNNLQGNNHKYFVVDLSKEEEIINLVSRLPKLNGAVYCAGITGHMPAKFIKKNHLSDMFAVNYDAPVLLIGKLLRKKKLSNNSSIVFISSLATQQPFFGGSAYVSSKSALEGYTKVLAMEIAPKGMRANCISPGFVKTAMIEETAETVSQEVIDKVEKAQMLGSGTPEDVSNTIIFFLSDASRWITGSNLFMGGQIIPNK